MDSNCPDRWSRRAALQALAAGVAWPVAAQTPRTLTDSAGRAVQVPSQVARVFPAGPPAAIWLYTLAPETLLGWPRANRPDEREFLLPDVAARPEVGRLTGRGNTANLETVLALKPDLIVDTGSVRQTFVELADRVQSQTGIPYALIDGALEAVPEGYRLLGELLGRQARAAELARYASDTLAQVRERVARVPRERRPRVYYARGPHGMETGLDGSINVEMFEAMGIELVSTRMPGGLARVSVEQVLNWDPEVIITIDQTFAQTVGSSPLWRGVSAVRHGRVHLSPKLPFGWVDFPPSVNRLPGLWWIGAKVLPEQFRDDLGAIARDFYRRFYQVDLSAGQVRRVLAGRD
ncbi:MAG: iron ABC transporter substrate-binding protein [Hydrogenophaga sp.]|uniref:iron ABC transporter substrate-binding protein n=1 Tax=Hydrogenophaga sp. TaxID=1904254 RepID=UPI001D3E92E3|nr:iron ABC transporter substrate-binding protein [Hydrogenophaga sp.]MBX3611345.1 iron ABC transporter substrate-binding protein [Hydrogenophaga sp.]